MSRHATGTARVVSVTAGVEHGDRAGGVRDARHTALAVLIGRWVNEGRTTGTLETASVPILTSDVYEWAPGGFFVVHTAFGKIGGTSVGGTEVIGVDGDAYFSTFYDSFGNVRQSRLEIDGDELRWTGTRTRSAATLTDGGLTQVVRHEASPDGVHWAESMRVTLRKVS